MCGEGGISSSKLYDIDMLGFSVFLFLSVSSVEKNRVRLHSLSQDTRGA